ncbi:Integrase catalytic core protein [Phytophthora palmivora]|uniref:Integrase catalytic core protein n=1 Tax=Phytophthora palmivora TaxID=4796 RepID=A0A2P4XBM9_9STRA|nr:Integrase catalytic core protein [Phytophthora palmivora]
MTVSLPVSGEMGVVTVGRFQSLVGSLLWIARCTRPHISVAVHKATRKTHNPSMSDWKLAKRILRYLSGTKELRLQMKRNRGSGEAVEIVAYRDADFAADKTDRKSVTGVTGWDASVLGVQETRWSVDLHHGRRVHSCLCNTGRAPGNTAFAKANHIDIRVRFVGFYTQKGLSKPEYREGVAMPVDLITKTLDALRLANLRVQVVIH